MSHKKLQERIEKATAQMKANRAELEETAKAIHGEFYAKTLGTTVDMIVSLKMVSHSIDMTVLERIREAAACCIMCGIYQIFIDRKIESNTPEAQKLAEAFQRDVVAMSNHGYQRINVKAGDLEDGDDA